MNDEVKLLINNIARDIIRVFNIDIPVMNIEGEIHKLGGAIEKNHNTENIVGEGIRKKDKSFVIVVSPFQSLERRKFIIAHEIGHLFLHMGYKINNKIWNSQPNDKYYRSNNIKFEYQANAFARAFLMPQKNYKDIMDKYTEENKVDTVKIAEFFGVSASAASNRGKFLGYLK